MFARDRKRAPTAMRLVGSFIISTRKHHWALETTQGLKRRFRPSSPTNDGRPCGRGLDIAEGCKQRRAGESASASVIVGDIVLAELANDTKLLQVTAKRQ